LANLIQMASPSPPMPPVTSATLFVVVIQLPLKMIVDCVRLTTRIFRVQHQVSRRLRFNSKIYETAIQALDRKDSALPLSPFPTSPQ
jgi:hypothetical protein